MGAWSHGGFDNDDAMDWVGELEATKADSPVSEALDSVLDAEGEYLEVVEASIGVAASEVVAALLGRPCAGLPDAVTAWVAGRKAPSATVVDKARRVVSRVLDDSELKDLWGESEESTKWRACVESLLQRLGKPSS